VAELAVVPGQIRETVSPEASPAPGRESLNAHAGRREASDEPRRYYMTVMPLLGMTAIRPGDDVGRGRNRNRDR
jgi:hypothetical protein